MFYEGGLQSGIALALQNSKSIVCFVSDDNEESKTWEESWLKDDKLTTLLQSRAVSLRIEAGSQEAGFLAAFAPISDTPTLLVIRNGRVVETISKGASRDILVEKLSKTLEDGEEDELEAYQPTSSGAALEPPQLPAPASTQRTILPPTTAPAPIPAPVPEPIAVPASAPASSPEPARISSPDLQPQPDTETRPIPRTQIPPETSDNKQSNSAPSPSSSSSTNTTTTPIQTQTQRSSDQNSWLALQRQRQLDARQERDRIMAQIEADKQERRAREAERRRQQLSAQASSAEAPPSSSAHAPSGHTGPSKTSTSKTTNIQVRMLDGGTIRSTFLATASPSSVLRPWIDEALAAVVGTSSPAYKLKQILAPPQQARTIEVSEEGQSFTELGLVPSATLVLVPEPHHVEAYAGAAPGGLVQGLMGLPYNAVSGAYGLVSGGVGAVSGALGGLLGYPSTGGEGDLTSTSGGRTIASDDNRARIRTLADQRAGQQRDTQLYNGNQLNFQSNDEDKDQ